MRIVIVTDAWEPQINGVVNTLKATTACLRAMGHEVLLVTSEGLRTFPCPTYPDIRLACQPYSKVATMLRAFEPDCIHIATEGPMGLAARRYCLQGGLSFSTAYHTRFPEYVRARTRIPLAWTYRWLRWFHGPSKNIMVPTPRVKQVLEEHGFQRVGLWGRGVNTEHFAPDESERDHSEDHPSVKRPLFLYVGRIAVEKNVEAFLRLDLPGTKWLIGDGPQREELEKKYPNARFLGAKANALLPAYYRCADVFVFPSLTDTFGLVLVEAMACGVPVAAYPVEGPIDVVAQGRSGSLHNDLQHACLEALTLSRSHTREHALGYSWEAATQQFLQLLHPAQPAARRLGRTAAV
ncbi:MAG: glycosyltransferase family 1 protein [Burkholderiaceae bacterium]|nr:glycosyltransferase family 1 protein [Burkholderiaceae bacterium]